MPHRQRIHVPGGTYYVVRRTHSPKPIFSHPDDYALIEGLLPGVLRRTGAQLLGYCFMPDAIHLALQIDEAPVGDFMRELTSYYCRDIHRRSGERGQLFRCPYQSTLIDPDAYLSSLIQYLHYIPVLAGLVRQPEDHPYSSHRAYLGSVQGSLLNTKPLLRLINSSDTARVAYRRLMAESPPSSIGALLERGHSAAPGIVGNADFIAGLPRRGRVSRSKLSMDEIAAHVVRTHGLSHALFVSRSRQHRLVVARAQFAWYVTERRVASLGQAARYLGQSSSSLTRAVARHQLRQPELFTFHAFAALSPLSLSSSNSDRNEGRPVTRKLGAGVSL